MADRDDGATLTATIAQACANGTATVIGGHGSKSFFTRNVEGELVSTVDHIGVLDYRPDELVITTRSGMPLKDLASIVAAENQMIPFDPPHFNGRGTVGGALATGLSGPGRPWFGSARDCVLGVEIVNGLGELKVIEDRALERGGAHARAVVLDLNDDTRVAAHKPTGSGIANS